MRLASFNVENLFRRARALNEADWDAGKEVLGEFSRLNSLLQLPVYTDTDKTEIVQSLERLGLKRNDESKLVILRQNKGRLLRRPRTGSPEVIAGGRGDWVGWLELIREDINATAQAMTARVIKDVAADVLAVVEAEDRIALLRFNDQLLKPDGAAYGGIMLIDGNDERGIDVGLMVRPPLRIDTMVSHVDDVLDGRRIFSRDSPEYTVRGGGNTSILVLVNHFKSKGYGTQADSNARRRLQAQRVREIYDQRRAEGVELIAIVGDFNDIPASQPLQPLLGAGSDLRDITDHERFESDGRPGTYLNGAAGQKIDYLLLSPKLFERVTRGGIFRKGVWGGKNGTLFPHYEEMTKPVHAASDHAAIWADVEL